MRILLINHFPLEGSGSGVYTLNTAKSLIKKGHEVSIIMPEVTTKYKRYDNIKLNPVYFLDKEKIEGQLPFNFPCFTTHPKSTNNFFDMTDSDINLYIDTFDKKIKKEIDEFKPDIIHVQHIWILAYVATKYNIPVVITAHGTDIIGHERSNRFHKYTNEAAKKCKKIICISDDNKELVLNNFPFVNDKVMQIKNGYDETVFYKEKYDKKEVLKELGINKDYNKIVCFAGKLTKIKGVDVLLEAANVYEKKDVLTLIAGNGELFGELNNLKDKLGLKNVYFLGNKDHDTLRKIYNISDVSIVPSRFEAFGLVAVEALACGTFVIASNVGGLPGIINNKVGIITKKDDSKMLAKFIDDVLNKKITYNSNSASKYAYDNYAQTSIIDSLINVYKSVI